MDAQSRPLVLDAVRSGHHTVAAIAAETGLHANTVRAQLSRLTADGLVQRTTASSVGRGRPVSEYRPSPRMRTTISGRPSTDALQEATLDLVVSGFGTADVPTAEDVDACGRRLANELPEPPPDMTADESLQDLKATLGALGFDPWLDGSRLTLQRCPLLGLAHSLPNIACGIHAAILRERLARTGGHWQSELRPFHDGGLCLVNVRSTRD